MFLSRRLVVSGYEDTLSDLIKITREHVTQSVWLTWAIAQRADADTSVKASIEYMLLLT